MPQEWIHVNTTVVSTGEPEPRGRRSNPFETFPDGTDPNGGGAFGPTKDSMFLPVTRETPPAYDPVTQSLVESSAQEFGGARFWPGEFDAAYPTDPYQHGDWVVRYTIVGAALQDAKDAKLAVLKTDYIAALNTGVAQGGFRFKQGDLENSYEDLVERVEFLTTVVLRYVAGEANSWTPPGKTLFYSDSDGLAADSNTNAMQTRFASWGNDYNDKKEIYRNAETAINAAADVAAVDAVTWTFP